MGIYKSGIGTPYWYEWEIGIIKCLEMLADQRIGSVVLQSSDFKSLDDVVVNFVDGTSCNIQVKHTDVKASFTYGTLTGGTNPMLQSWARDWKSSKDSFQIAEIHVVTNKKWGPNRSGGKCSFATFVKDVLPLLKESYEYCGKNAEERKAIEWLKNQLRFLGDDAETFVKLLSFDLLGSLSSVEKQIEQKIKRILGTDNETANQLAKNALFAMLSTWATSKRSRQEITREDVYKVLCNDAPQLPQYELYPEKPVFPSRTRFAERFFNLLQSTDKKIVFLEGIPGSGKTNFVSYLAQIDNAPLDFRFYTYLPVNKEYPSYSDDEGYFSGELLWKSILSF